MPDGFAGRPEEGVWDRLCDTLEDMSLLATADWAAMERYCDAVVEWRACNEFLRRNGRTFTLLTPNPQVPHIGEVPRAGGVVMYAVARCPHPEVKLKAEAVREMRAFEQAFGLTPGARTRLSAPAPGPALADGEGGGVRSRVRG